MGKTANNVKECSECKSTFIRQSDMIRHIKRFHSSKAEKLIACVENKNPVFRCDQCNKTFSHKKNLSFHQKSHTAIQNSGVIIRKKCPLCNHVATFKKDFYDHCRESHKILLDVEKMDFGSVDDFVNWKSEIEKALNSKFVKEYGSTAKMTNYICSQSEYSVLENGVEKEEISQTDKINGFCPAGFRVMHEENGKCSIYFVKTHICRQNKNLSFPNNAADTDQSKEKSQKIKEEDTSNNVSMKLESSKVNHENEMEDVSQSDSKPRRKKKLEKSSVNSKRNFLNRKKEMIRNILSTLNAVSTITELDAVQELISPIKPILEILKRKSVERSPKGKSSQI